MMITLRVRSAERVERIQVSPDDTIDKVCAGVGAEAGGYLSSDPSGANRLAGTAKVGSALGHGDFVYLHRDAGNDSSSGGNSASGPKDSGEQLDRLLARRSGRMRRELDSKMCRHGAGGMCEHCQPLEPWQIPQIASAKHLPVHVYMRQHRVSCIADVVAPPDRAGSAKCRHADRAKCCHCLPPTIVLKRQPFRLVDHVEFVGNEGVERVVQEWRRSGLQRFAWLYGCYRERSGEDWDLGAKAVVEFVYQPPQDSATDGVQLMEELGDNDVGLRAARTMDGESQLIGCLYTDLHDDGSGTGKVVKRPYFVSSPELQFMAQQQSTNPRFITCILSSFQQDDAAINSGSSNSPNSNVEIEAFMASQEAVWYCTGQLIKASTDPHSMIVADNDRAAGGGCEFVYAQKNEYSYSVSVRAKAGDTLPVDYFLVSLTHGFTAAGDIDPFPPPHLFPSVQQALDAVGSGQLTFNLLLFLYSKYGADVGLDEIYHRLLTDYSAAPNSGSSNTNDGTNGGWACPHCTFINDPGSQDDCAMCGLPKQQ